jgi:hypothetical protein
MSQVTSHWPVNQEGKPFEYTMYQSKKNVTEKYSLPKSWCRTQSVSSRPWWFLEMQTNAHGL